LFAGVPTRAFRYAHANEQLGVGVASATTSRSGPRAEYLRRLEDRKQRRDALGWREGLAGNGRVLVFLGGLVLAWLAFGAGLLSGWWLLVPAVLFTVLLFHHEKITRAWHRATRAVAFYEAGLARLDGRWQGQGQPGRHYVEDTHPCAADLDLFGPGSLFELLCTARTRAGEDTLAGWLLTPAHAEEVRARQGAVAELRDRLDLREDLALLGAEASAGVDFTAVVGWGAADPILEPRWPRWLALAVGIVALVAAVQWLLGDWPAAALAGIIVAELALTAWLGPSVRTVLRTVEERARDLALLASVLRRLEQAEFTSPRLTELKADLVGPVSPAGPELPKSPLGSRGLPSQRIAALSNLVDLLNSRRNQLFLPFALLLLWGTQMAYALETWRSASGKAIGTWLDVVGKFEALCALAGYAYENPDDPFPEVTAGPACFEGEGLGHPLLPIDGCVRNDLCLGGESRLLVVSGSNMSGKSTFLRTAGVNAVLALAGAPVRARRLRLSPLAVGATLRIQDSLQAGRSRFYAELLRVRQLVDLARGTPPLFFLLDEIFAGTNSHDRRIGAEAVVGGLVEAGAIGLITTHDLALTHIADHLAPRAANVHFADHLVDGAMTFDFRLRPGVVQHSNALALMRAVGLDV
jgi:hypothetical protein